MTDMPMTTSRTYLITVCPLCEQMTGYPGWSAECKEHGNRGVDVVVRPMGERRWNRETQTYDLLPWPRPEGGDERSDDGIGSDT